MAAVPTREQRERDKADILAFMMVYHAKYNVPPSMLEIGKGVYRSKSYVSGMVQIMVSGGLLSQKQGKARTAVVTEAGKLFVQRVKGPDANKTTAA